MNRDEKDFLRVSVVTAGSHTGQRQRAVRVVEGGGGVGVRLVELCGIDCGGVVT